MNGARFLRTFGTAAVALLCAATILLALQFSAGLNALARISANNLAFVGSSAVVELLRVRSALSHPTDANELRLRADLFASRVRLLSEGDFKTFADLQIGGPDLVAELLDLSGRIRDATMALEPALDGFEEELRRLERPLIHMASRANQAGGDRIGQKRSELQELFTLLVVVAGASIVLVIVLLARLFLDHRALRRRNTELRQAKDRYHDLAHRDHLTGIANRASFMREAAVQTLPTIAVIDLDGFKEVNDRFGHATGDEVLAAVAHRMVQIVGDRGLVARIGGDEFAILSQMDERYFPALVDRVAEEIRLPFHTQAGLATIGASTGLSRIRDGEDILALIARADEAMYRAKRSRRLRRITGEADAAA